ncbi:MAG: hypothetical protein SGCHY_003224 [Lobulomycetales sp.]
MLRYNTDALAADLLEALTAYLNAIFSGIAATAYAPYFGSATLIPGPPPKGQWGYTPDRHRLHLAQTGFQVGVGSRAGTEAVIHAIQRYVDEHGEDSNHSPMALDDENAFNLLDRQTALEEVAEHAPSILRGVFYVYTRSVPLFVGDQELRRALDIIMERGPSYARPDWSSFPPEIIRNDAHGFKILGGAASVAQGQLNCLIEEAKEDMDKIASLRTAHHQFVLLKDCINSYKFAHFFAPLTPRSIRRTSWKLTA